MVDVPAVVTTAGPSAKIWAAHRPLITRLYQAESRPLKEVIGLLEKDHGFRASEKMYKSRIRKWKIDKKRKRPEMLFALKMIESRRQQGKSTCVTIRGHKITEAEVRRYFIRQKTSATEDAIAYHTAPTPPELEYGTPTSQYVKISSKGKHKSRSIRQASAESSRSESSGRLAQNNQDSCNEPEPCALTMAAEATSWPVDAPYPELQVVRSRSPLLQSKVYVKNKSRQSQNGGPQLSTTFSPCAVHSLEPFSYGVWSCNFETALSICEEALSLVEDYYTRYYFRSSGWTRFANDTLFAVRVDARKSVLEHHEALYADLNDPGQMTSSIEVAVEMFDQGQIEAAGGLLESACAGIKALVIEQHPQLLSRLLKSLSLVCTTRYSEVNQIILRHIHDVALLVLGENHPLVRLSSLLAQAIAENGCFADRALRLLIDVFSAHAGPLHPASLNAMYTYAWSALRRHDFAQARRIFRHLQDIYEKNTGTEGLESRKMLYGLAQVHLMQGETALAKELLEELQRRTEQRFGADTPVESKIEVLQVRALLCKRALEFEEMHILLWQAYELGADQQASDNGPARQRPKQLPSKMQLPMRLQR